MICPKCGDDLPKNSKICKSCGNNINNYRESRSVILLVSVAIVLIMVVIIGLVFIEN